MASYKTSSNKKKELKQKNPPVDAPKKRKKRAPQAKTSTKVTAQIQEITEQISIIEIVSESAIAAKPFLLVFMALFCVFVALALFSYSPGDIANIAEGPVGNWGGILGALISKNLYSLLGYGSWVVLPIAGLCSWKAAGRPFLSMFKFSGVVVMYWTILCFFSLLIVGETQLGFFAGGIIGQASVAVMTKLIGQAGAWLLLGGTALAMVVFVAGMELKEIVEHSLQRLEEKGPDIGQRSWHWGQDVLEKLKETSRGMMADVRGRFQNEEYDEDEWYSETGTVYTDAMYTDDGMEYTDSDSMPPSRFDLPSEEALSEEYSEAYSEEYSYDIDAYDMDSDVTRTKVQQQAVGQLDWSGIFETQASDIQVDETFNPEPVIQPVAKKPVKSVQQSNVAKVSKKPMAQNIQQMDRIPTQTSIEEQSQKEREHQKNIQPQKKVAPVPSSNLQQHVLQNVVAQDNITMPEDEWDEDLSEWYSTASHSRTTQGKLNAPIGRISPLPEGLFEHLEAVVREHTDPTCNTETTNAPVMKPSVAHELRPANKESVNPPVETVQPSSPVHSTALKSESKPVAKTSEKPTLQEPKAVSAKPVHQVQEAQMKSMVSSVQPMCDDSYEEMDPSDESSIEKSVNQDISLPELDVTPEYGMEALDEEEVSEDYSDSTPARVMVGNGKVNPGNMSTGGKGEVQSLRNPYVDFELPSLSMLDIHERDEAKFDEDELMEMADTLVDKLADFKVMGEVETICPGPVITTFEFKPGRGVRVSKIANLADDIAMALKAVNVRIVAPIPGKDVVGIEIPNKVRQMIWSRDMLGSKVFQDHTGVLPMALGKTVDGFPYVTDLTKTPHLLVAGTTGSGKSVGVNTMLVSMLLRHSPETLRFILIDPKQLEFKMYDNIPHLLYPVITEMEKAAGIMQWAVEEMESRYEMMSRFKTRNIISFNERLKEEMQDWNASKMAYYAPDDWDGVTPYRPKTMPYIVIVIDELADLILNVGKDVEEPIIRIAQKARACGIHLIVATQRPSADVVTGLIKANMPSRLCFTVRTRNESRIILDNPGGETLLGHGDMLYLPPGSSNLIRCHGPFLSDNEVRRVTDHLRAQGKPIFEAEIKTDIADNDEIEGDYDPYYDEAVAFVIEKGSASTSAVQRQFRIGYNRAARIIEQMERDGLIGAQQGSKPRKIIGSLD